MEDRASVAEAAFRNYDFGPGVEVEEDVEGEGEGQVLDPATAEHIAHESREWTHSITGNEWRRPVYVRTNGGGDEYFWVRLMFIVRFFPLATHEAFALDGDGCVWGRIRESAGRQPNRRESLLKGPWAWRSYTYEAGNRTAAMILETTARPREDPVIIQALAGRRGFQGERAAALELIRLAPEMLRLLAEIAQASKVSPADLPAYASEAEALLDNLTQEYYTVDFRVPGYWSAAE